VAAWVELACNNEAHCVENADRPLTQRVPSSDSSDTVLCTKMDRAPNPDRAALMLSLRWHWCAPYKFL
jgi:hypothetical protein